MVAVALLAVLALAPALVLSAAVNNSIVYHNGTARMRSLPHFS
jgi:hypothetical protein